MISMNRRTLLFALLVGMMLSLVIAGITAQEQDPPLMPVVPDNLTGTFVNEAPSGALVDRLDGTHVLILQHACETTAWTLEEPCADDLGTETDLVPYPPELTTLSGELTTQAFTRGWRRMGLLQGHGQLDLGELVLALTLETPLLNPQSGTLTYTVVIEEVIFPEDTCLEDLGPLNVRFDEATLYIDITSDFMMALQEGIVPEPKPTCVPTGIGVIDEACNSR